MSKLAKLKTTETEASVEDFLNAVEDKQKREDCFALLDVMKRMSGNEPKLWGSSMVGFGNKIFKSPATGRETEWFKIGFSPRKANISIYVLLHALDHSSSLEKLGKFKAGMGCVYVKMLSDIDMNVLEEMIQNTLNLLNSDSPLFVDNSQSKTK
ncbi:MAG: DUF1801 domain-containing protein [Chloroflexota bacterium]